MAALSPLAALGRARVDAFTARQRAAAATAAAALAIPALGNILRELLPAFDFTIGGHKTSHKNKRNRSAGKHLHRKTNIVECPSCGRPKLMHHLCPACHSYIARLFKASDEMFGHHRIEPRLPTFRAGGFEAHERMDQATAEAEKRRKLRVPDALNEDQPGSLMSRLKQHRVERALLKPSRSTLPGASTPAQAGYGARLGNWAARTLDRMRG